MLNEQVCLISSSGGHLAQIKQLAPIISKYNSFFITEKNLSTSNLRESYKTFYLKQQDRKQKLFILLLLLNFITSLKIFLKEKPKVIISTGAGCVIPFCLIGKIFGAKIIFIESFAKVNSPTVTGRIIYLFANEFYVQWEEMKKFYPNATYKGALY